MIDLLCCFRNRHHPIRLNTEFRLDLLWWLPFFHEWNGVSFLSLSVTPLPDLVVSSDAFGLRGFGAFWHREWFCSSWFFLPSQPSIAFMELVPIVVAAHLRVQFSCNNLAVVQVLNTGTSKSPEVMHLLRSLTFRVASHAVCNLSIQFQRLGSRPHYYVHCGGSLLPH